MKTGYTLAGMAAASLVALSIGTVPASAEIANHRVKLGVLTDMSGFASDSTGQGSVVAAELAAEDFAKELPGVTIEVIHADHQNKPDIGAATARRWLDQEHVDAILDVPFSSVALAVNEVTRNSKAVFIASGPGTTELTGPKCSPNTIQWTYDTWALANGTARAVTESGGKRWFFMTADYAFGHALERDASAVVKSMGGTIVGSVRHPPNASDFSSYLLQAQGSGAQVIGLANAVGDTIGSVKQATEFGITAGGQRLAALLMQLSDVAAVGLKDAQGLYLTEAFYWDLNPGTRAFADRFAARMDGRRPTGNQAGVYAGALHYLKAVKAANSTDATIVAAKMRDLPTDDPLFGKGSVRVDGRAVHDMLFFEVKKPEESKGPWDFYKLIKTIPGPEAFRPLSEGGCPLVQK
ncbi:ABC transporter substrate-binding protein (plasmid) [Azospirillum oryzae]|uniref:ABC transporter substrate-binding protein n=1 Tax=Azospirillum oryzae TaxID=286727 RepID=A0A6N1AHD1_9PROT|nr:ABC transporter substrate-binding protein [Azospirillum oryzae]KAA0587454.1 ABC transporter substrate-binding protein [Azospirillum oryzae]QKS50488.1 ABC transporter substrate-binding protein [Azospirillum oryzae]GLR78743.1 ABC transporter substrate-binding protein [Azospirillum oryzae]